jgi:hypothetical protein
VKQAKRKSQHPHLGEKGNFKIISFKESFYDVVDR